MKRFHVHTHVQDLQASIAFYSRLFGAQPARIEADYAKWMLEDPRLNFAISTRGDKPGVDHFGMQVDSQEELAALRSQAQAAGAALQDEGETTCCYSRSDKHWITDPQGIRLGAFPDAGRHPRVPRKGPRGRAEASATACCAPSPTAHREA